MRVICVRPFVGIWLELGTPSHGVVTPNVGEEYTVIGSTESGYFLAELQRSVAHNKDNFVVVPPHEEVETASTFLQQRMLTWLHVSILNVVRNLCHSDI